MLKFRDKVDAELARVSPIIVAGPSAALTHREFKNTYDMVWSASVFRR